MIAPVERQIRERVGEYIFGVDQQTLSDVLIGLIAEHGLRLATAESSTRGELARQLGDAAKGRPAFAGGVVALDAETLQRSLGLSTQEIGQSYPNQEIADAAARAACRLYGADLA
jgi:nicotinamide-nucleotide amidase